MVLAVLLAATAVTPALAVETRTGDEPSVPSGEVVDDDVYLFGGDILIAGTVTRDAVVAGQNLDVTGQIDGNLMVAANDVDVRGPVGRTIRVGSGEVRISAPVGGDLLAGSGAITIEAGGSVAGDVVAAGDVTIRGEVLGDVRVSGGEVFIDAPVGGDVRVNADEIRLGPNARIAGVFFYDSDNEDEPTIDPAATLANPAERRDLGDNVNVTPDIGIDGGWFDFLRLFAALASGLVIVLLLPRAAVAVADGGRARPLRAFLIGLGLLVLGPIALVIVMVTVIGIPIALVGWVIYGVALYLSQVFVGLALGRAALTRTRFGANPGRGVNAAAMAIGVIVLFLLRLIPFLGFAVTGLITVLGLGALGLAVWRGRGASPPVAATPAVAG